MPHTEIHELGRLLVEWARDEVIRSFDRTLQGGGADPISKRWKAAIAAGRPEEALRAAIPDIVDHTIGQLLAGIDQGVLQLTFTASNGVTVNLPRDGLGELCGWYMGEWIFKYSKERVVDDFADLRKRALRLFPPAKKPE
jgi:hypothetical protein